MKYSGLSLLIFASFFFLNLTLLSGCSNQEEKNQTTVLEPVFLRGGIYRAPLWNNPATIDPAYVQDQYGVSIVKQVFDGLVRFDPYLSILPALAETWQIKDEGKFYRFVLSDSAQFHNMDSVTSSDVIFSIKRLLRTEPAPAILPHLLKIVGANEYRDGTTERVTGMVIEDKKIFTIRLQESYVPFLTALGMYQAAIVPEKEVKRLGNNFGKHPIGTGPFSFVSWNTGKSIHLKKFKEYYAGPAFLDEIHYKIYSEEQVPVSIADFQNNKLEEMLVHGNVKEKLAGKDGLQWVHRPSLSLFFYGMNLRHGNLSNPDLRKALSMAIDRKMFVNKVYNDQFEIARTILPPGMPGYNPLNKMESYNPILARQYLKRSLGKTIDNQPELEIVSAFKTPRVEREMTMIKEFWLAIGIKAKVKYITDWKKFEAYLKSDSVQLYRYAWFADMPDPDSFLYSLFASDSPTNFMKLQDERVDKMLSNARRISDPVERAKEYQKIEAIIIEAAPLIPLFYMSVDRVYQPYVKSVKVNALGAHTMSLNKVWLDKSQHSN
jgi:ABC-type transport system substrate-binding protein